LLAFDWFVLMFCLVHSPKISNFWGRKDGEFFGQKEAPGVKSGEQL
jgi:hypothetical protein